MSIGKRLKEARLSRGMTQEQFARGINKSANTISRMERDTFSTNEKVLKALCAKYRINYDWIISGNGEMNLEPPLLLEKQGISNRIRLVRKTMGLTQKQFGEVIGVSGSAIQSIELGTRNASDGLLRTISEKTNCSYEWLMFGIIRPLSDEEQKKAENISERLSAFFRMHDNAGALLLSALNQEAAIIPSMERVIQILDMLEKNKE